MPRVFCGRRRKGLMRRSGPSANSRWKGLSFRTLPISPAQDPLMNCPRSTHLLIQRLPASAVHPRAARRGFGGNSSISLRKDCSSCWPAANSLSQSRTAAILGVLKERIRSPVLWPGTPFHPAAISTIHPLIESRRAPVQRSPWWPDRPCPSGWRRRRAARPCKAVSRLKMPPARITRQS